MQNRRNAWGIGLFLIGTILIMNGKVKTAETVVSVSTHVLGAQQVFVCESATVVEKGDKAQITSNTSFGKIAYQNEQDAIEEIWEQTNEQRKKEGLPALELDSSLMEIATCRAAECAQNAYFSHTRPNGTPWYTVFDEYGRNFSSCAENLAFTTNPMIEVVSLWMDSEGHKQNILSTVSKKIGIGISEGTEGIYVVQIFSN